MRQTMTHATTCWLPCWCLGMVRSSRFFLASAGTISLASAVSTQLWRHVCLDGLYTLGLCCWCCADFRLVRAQATTTTTTASLRQRPMAWSGGRWTFRITLSGVSWASVSFGSGCKQVKRVRV
jgi:hypothetical protein